MCLAGWLCWRLMPRAGQDRQWSRGRGRQRSGTSRNPAQSAMTSGLTHIKREAGAATAAQQPGQPSQAGIPVVATASRFTAPVHIDVGGKIYTSSLDTLTK